jgi:hypothetical protein
MAMKDQSETLKRLTKEYRSLGLSETEAKLAAQMEDAVRDVEQSSRSDRWWLSRFRTERAR